MWTALIGPVAELAGTFLKGKIDKQKAKSTVQIAEAEAKATVMKEAALHDSKWELIMAQSTQGSWKDELVTIVVLIPCVLAFVPGMEDVVKSGFERLAELPSWYQNLLIVVCTAAVGLRGLDKWKGKK